MRSSARVLALIVAACGASPALPDEPPGAPTPCEDSILTYANFGEPFMLDWCRGCHSSGLPADMRQGAPDGIDFDTLDQVRVHQPRIELRAAGSSDVAPTMPPAAGPGTDERALLAEWLACGAR